MNTHEFLSSAFAEALHAACDPLLNGMAVEVEAEVDSTNTQLLGRARINPVRPALMVSLSQTAGRGRLGRTWHGEPGESLMFSVGLLLDPKDWSGLSLAVGLAIAEALHPDISLKWPNDLWLGKGVGGRKLGGVLIETASTQVQFDTPTTARWCVVGVGINLKPRGNTDLRTPSAALSELLPLCDLASTATAVAPMLIKALKRFESQGFAPLRERFHARCALAQEAVLLSDGQSGVVQGVDATGALLVHTQFGDRHVSSDEVSVKPKPP